MKKFNSLLFIFLTYITAFSQQGPKWSTNGNSISANEFIGTTNNFPLDFKINNISRMLLGTDGGLTLVNLAGTNSRVLMADQNGKLLFIPSGQPGQFLESNGTWQNLPGGATSWQLIGSNLIATNTGNIGIGTSNPQNKLDVIGSVSISNNLFVGGGLITSQQVDATTMLNAGDVNATNNLNVAGNTTLNGSLTIPALGTGTAAYIPVFVDASGNFKTAPINEDDQFNTGCQISNPAWRVGGNIIAGTGMTNRSVGTCDNYPFILKANNTERIWLTGTAGSGRIGFGISTPTEQYHFNNGNILLDAGNMVLNNTSQSGTNFNKLRIRGAIDNTGLLVETNHIASGAYNTKLIVDRNESKAIGVLNTFADPNGYENFLVYGNGQTNVGWQPGSPNSAKLNVNVVAGGDAFNIYNQTTNQTCFSLKNSGVTEIVSNVPNVNDDVLTIRDGILPNTPAAVNFKIKRGGKTIIGNATQTTGPHTDAMLTVFGKIVTTSCYIKVVDWADYVFATDYKIPNLYEIETYYKANKHLEGIPSEKEVLENGINVAEMNKLLLKKIEEMTIIMVQQQKDIDLLKKSVK